MSVELLLVSDRPTRDTMRLLKDRNEEAIPVKSVPHLVNTAWRYLPLWETPRLES
jgi:hypothetical protein